MVKVEYNWVEIREYRKFELKEAVALIQDIWKDDKSPEYFKGVMTLFKRIMLLPKKLCTKEETEFIEDMIRQEFKQVEIDLLRKAVRD